MTLTSLFFEVLFPKKKTTHIDGSFLYPREGYGHIVETLEATLPRESVRTGHDIVRLECDRNRIRRIHFEDRPHFDPESRVVSTLPLTLTVKFLGDDVPDEVREAASGLRFRHIRLFFLRLAQPRVSDNASIYIPDPKMCVTRMYEPRNRSPKMAPPARHHWWSRCPASPTMRSMRPRPRISRPACSPNSTASGSSVRRRWSNGVITFC